MKTLIRGTVLGLAVLGGGGRIVMRVIALVIGDQPESSLDGTLIVLAVGAGIGLVSGAAYKLLQRAIPGGGVLRGVGFGLVLFAAATAILRASTGPITAPAWQTLLVAALFCFLFVVHGLVLERVLPPGSPS